VYRPYPTGDPAEPWYVPYLEHLAVNGGPKLAANYVSLPYRVVRSALRGDPAFEAEYEAARDFYQDLIEWESVDLARRRGNPLPYFARMKADQPERYVEKAQIATVTNILNVSPDANPAEAGAFLAQLLGSATNATKAEIEAMQKGRALGPGIIEGAATPVPPEPPGA
jgi:hypothetical protein